METGLPCPDWLISNTSNVHVARDRVWFSTYTPFATYIGEAYGASRLDVVGIGDVEIPVKLYPKRSGPRSHGILRLRNVLHAPTAFCNIVGSTSTGDYAGMQLGGMGKNFRDGQLMDAEGRRIAYIHAPGPVWVLKLSGPPVGPVVGESVFKQDEGYMINAIWPDSERSRWAAASGTQPTTGSNQQGASGGNGNREAQSSRPPPYTSEEKDWLKKNWGGEYRFHRCWGFNIHDEKDRDEVRQIVRAMMRNERGDEEEDEADADDGLVDDIERSFQGHFADCNFTKEELDFIERGWGNSEMFMLTYGLKFYNDDDCEEAKAIVRALMSDPEPMGEENDE
ncbi:50f88162-c8b7-49a5-a983-7e5aa8e5a23a [Thermothielavioides terrestris]|uniref:50f88162-c8b7-49a5-a983-7e5aa8e5a23a n=1 Tax=Thermothielavioides terrestris TaxID=2587410 RepID=A0A3S4C525_9PEZI|nr:50f88162-c8b7-49a5-a983-7e5aa8e5a23a [Thermothielavioides terrestris]